MNQDVVLNNYQTTTANAIAAVIDLVIEKSDIEPGDRIRTYAKSKGNSEWMLVGGRFGSRTQSKVDYASYEIIVKEDIDTGIEKVIQDDSSFSCRSTPNLYIFLLDCLKNMLQPVGYGDAFPHQHLDIKFTYLM